MPGWSEGLRPKCARWRGRCRRGALSWRWATPRIPLDPIGGQGANNGNKMARAYVDEIVTRGTLGFDAVWMQATFDRFWDRHRHNDLLNNTLLEPLPGAGKRLLMAQYGSTECRMMDSPQQQLADQLYRELQ